MNKNLFSRFLHMITAVVIASTIVFLPSIIKSENIALNNFASDMIVAIYDNGSVPVIRWEDHMPI